MGVSNSEVMKEKGENWSNACSRRFLAPLLLLLCFALVSRWSMESELATDLGLRSSLRIQTGDGDELYFEVQNFNSNRELPQKLIFGQFIDETSYPFLSCDIWANLVDNQRTFLLREWEEGFPGYSALTKWIASRPHPIAFVINNQIDRPWPYDLEATDWKEMLNEPNLHAVFVSGLISFDHEFMSKAKPLPLGLKFQNGNTDLFGQEKRQLKATYSLVSKSPQDSKELFESPNRTNTVWVRPMTLSNGGSTNYAKTNSALSTDRIDVAGLLRRSAPNSTVVEVSNFLNQKEYLDELKRHRFLANPAGNGIDTHSTWEALLAGCIPITPHSPLDPLFENLPVWHIYSWDEVTDDAVKKKAQEMSGRMYNWSLAFAPVWKKKIHEGLPPI